MMHYQSNYTETYYVQGASEHFAYCRFGPHADIPLILCRRLRGTIDYWDPALLDVPASERDVSIFDNRGSGTPPDTSERLADGLFEFIDALGFNQVGKVVRQWSDQLRGLPFVSYNHTYH